MKKIIDMPWERVKEEANHILENNASNNKITYDKFRKRWKEDKDFINELIKIFWYLDNSNKITYYKSMVNHFIQINDIVSTSNILPSWSNMVNLYNRAVNYYFVKNEDILDQKDLHNMTDRYKRYRGMAKLSKYNWDLEHPDLINRVVQYMQESDLKKYINNQDAEIDWKIAIENYKSDIKKTLS